MPGTDLAQFASEVARASAKPIDAFTDKRSTSNGGHATALTTKGVALVLPSYLTNQELVDPGSPREQPTFAATYGFFDNTPFIA
jgi:hypothetical protein